jgi:hypothetical protein
MGLPLPRGHSGKRSFRKTSFRGKVARGKHRFFGETSFWGNVVQGNIVRGNDIWGNVIRGIAVEPILYILLSFGIFCGHFGIFFTVLVCCTKKNLSTLKRTRKIVNADTPEAVPMILYIRGVSPQTG